MCGIAGVFPIRQRLNELTIRDALGKMNDEQSHRGPDAEGIWLSDWGAGLAHTRLSIIDLSSNANQPFVDENSRYIISFNGEIYNHRELKKDLEAKGHQFRSNSDTEVLLKSYMEWGTHVFEKLDGMYALGILDQNKRELLLARDPFGEKPLFYTEQEGVFWFGSELKALSHIPGFSPKVSNDSIAEYLSLQYLHAPNTLFHHLKKLEPGHWKRISQNGVVQTGRHFEYAPIEEKCNRSIDELSEELEALLVESLKRRLRADVPLGLFLSGGIDSSLVAALVTQKLNTQVKSFSLGFHNSSESEHSEARLIADELGLEHHEYLLGTGELADYQNIADILDEPNGDTSLLPMWNLSRFARKHVKVCLSGDGGDELFFGYNRYLEYGTELTANDYNVLKTSPYYDKRILILTELEIRNMLGEIPPNFEDLLNNLKESTKKQPLNWFDHVRKTDVEHYMPGAVLAKVDRMSMQHSLEVRTPFLTRDIASFSEKLGLKQLSQGAKGKILLRKILSKYLTEEVVNRKKSGFGIPMANWGLDHLENCWEKEKRTSSNNLWWLKNPMAIQHFGAYQYWALLVLTRYLQSNQCCPSPQTISAGFALQMKSKDQGRIENEALTTPNFDSPSEAPLCFNRWTQQSIPFTLKQSFADFNKGLRLLIGKKLAREEQIYAAFGDDYALWSHNTFQRSLRLLGELWGWVNYRISEQALLRSSLLKSDDEPPKNIRKLTLVISTLGAGGAERQIVLLAEELVRNGADVELIVFSNLSGSTGHYCEYLKKKGITVRSLRNFSVEKVPHSFLDDKSQVIRLVNRLPKIIREEVWKLTVYLKQTSPDGIQAFLDHPNLVAGWAGLFAEIPVIGMSFRNVNPTSFSFYQTWFRRHYLALLKSSKIRLSGNSTNGNTDYAKWLSIDQKSISLVHNGVDPEQFKPSTAKKQLARKELEIEDSDFVILGAFRFSEEKRPLDFLNVCFQVMQNHPNVHVALAGEGPLEDAIEKEISKSEFKKHFHMLGRVPNMEKWISLADCVLLCSEREGTPNILLEAQSCGKPVVATNAGGIPEVVIDNETGLISQVGDLKGLSDSIIKLINDEELCHQMGCKSREHILEHFSLATMANNFLDLLQR